jgi:hypothetical protein
MARKKITEDGLALLATNNAGSGGVAGIGIGPSGEPPGKQPTRRRKLLRDIIDPNRPLLKSRLA